MGNGKDEPGTVRKSVAVIWACDKENVMKKVLRMNIDGYETRKIPK